MTTRRIVVGYDRSDDAKAAAAWALDEASRTGAPVEFLYAYEWPVWAPTASMVPATSIWPDGETDRAIKDTLNTAVADAKQNFPAVRTTLSLVYADAAVTLIDRSAEASLVVLGSRGHSAVAGLLGSVSAAVSAHAHCPVVVVRGQPAGGPVVAGVDDSASARSAAFFAADQALARRAPLRLLRAWKPVTGLWEATPLVTRQVTSTERQSFDELVAIVRDKYPGLEIVADAVVDHPADALAKASATAQLLVVGSRGRGAVRSALLGSVSQHLLRHSACTVVVIHNA
ncbi:universal stress protein [Paractinoplanes rishiriensis]|uniref:Universal stress protein n=1 Tax=Paractinoplanes rishiriensis TaxID=1050105 RepID=A0A919N002_9ACTN|nr:universal stress protein [Actinoplanes rishiriensis]GIF02189.1 universal stress protein [Actinoplanes rishiriensis]